MELLHYLPASALSFVFFHFASRDELKMKGKLPKVKISKVEISPNIRIYFKNRVLHMHHWLNLSILLAISIPVHNALLDAQFTKGLFMGGILQGLLSPNSSKIIYKKGEIWVTTHVPYTQKLKKFLPKFRS